MTDAAKGEVVQTFDYEIEERPDGVWTRFINEDGSLREWFGPYPDHDAAEAGVQRAIEDVVKAFTKALLGLN